MSDEVLEKSENQLDKLDESVDKAIQDMGTVYKIITDKLEKDGVDFITKEPLKPDFQIIEVPAKKVDKGLVAFIAINKEEKNE